MKQFIVNFYALLFYFITTFVLFLWFGKLPKVSPYHWTKYSPDFSDTFDDVHFQSRIDPDKEQEIRKVPDYIVQAMRNNPDLHELLTQSVKKYVNGKYTGTETLYTKLRDELKKLQ